MKLTDTEILDFVKENITIAKGMTGHIEITGVHCSVLAEDAIKSAVQNVRDKKK